MPDDERYRAEPVRVERARVEHRERSRLASAVGTARGAQAELDELRVRAEQARAKLASAHRASEAQRSASAYVLAERFIARCRRALEAALDAVAAAEEALASRATAVDAARRALVRAKAEREVIERHFARWREARRRLAERRAD